MKRKEGEERTDNEEKKERKKGRERERKEENRSNIPVKSLILILPSSLMNLISPMWIIVDINLNIQSTSFSSHPT